MIFPTFLMLLFVEVTTDKIKKEKERGKEKTTERTQTKLSASHVSGIMYKY